MQISFKSISNLFQFIQNRERTNLCADFILIHFKPFQICFNLSKTERISQPLCRFHINPFQTISISFQFSYNCQWPPCWPHPYIPNQPRYQEGLSFNNITVWNDLKRFEMNFKWFTYRNLTLKPTRRPWGLVSFMNSFELEYFDRNMQMRFKFISIHLNFISIQTK